MISHNPDFWGLNLAKGAVEWDRFQEFPHDDTQPLEVDVTNGLGDLNRGILSGDFQRYFDLNWLEDRARNSV